MISGGDDVVGGFGGGAVGQGVCPWVPDVSREMEEYSVDGPGCLLCCCFCEAEVGGKIRICLSGDIEPPHLVDEKNIPR